MLMVVIVTVVTVVVIVTSFSKNNSTTQQPMRFSGQLFAILVMFFVDGFPTQGEGSFCPIITYLSCHK